MISSVKKLRFISELYNNSAVRLATHLLDAIWDARLSIFWAYRKGETELAVSPLQYPAIQTILHACWLFYISPKLHLLLVHLAQLWHIHFKIKGIGLPN